MITVESCKNRDLFRVVDSAYSEALEENVETTYMIRLHDDDKSVVVSDHGVEISSGLRSILLKAVSELLEREAGRKKFLAMVAEFEENK